jgi:hypothetical protein
MDTPTQPNVPEPTPEPARTYEQQPPPTPALAPPPSPKPKPKRGVLSKILLGLLALLVVCCGLSVLSAVIAPRPAKAPVSAPAIDITPQVTIVGATSAPALQPDPTTAPVVVPTAVPEATTPPSARQVYAAQLGEIATRSSANFRELVDLATSAGSDISLINDASWRSKVAVVIETLRIHAREFRNIQAPAEMADVHALVNEMADSMDQIADDFDAGVKTGDADKFVSATSAMTRMTALTQQVTQKLTNQ